jgi:hypothetical protein
MRYSGYNDIEKVSSRRRAACLAHVRRYFFDSLKTAPVAQEALDFITELYRVEHDAKEWQLSKAAKLELRKQRAGPIRARFKDWLDAQRARHPPKSPLGVAIRYTLGQWNELGAFLVDARVPLDNNASERSLRRIAELPLRRRRRGGQEPRRSLLARRDVRVTRDQSLRLSRRCPRARAGPSGQCARRTSARRVGCESLSASRATPHAVVQPIVPQTVTDNLPNHRITHGPPQPPPLDDTVRERLGGVDITVSNVGGSTSPAGGFALLTDGEWRRAHARYRRPSAGSLSGRLSGQLYASTGPAIAKLLSDSDRLWPIR